MYTKEDGKKILGRAANGILNKIGGGQEGSKGGEKDDDAAINALIDKLAPVCEQFGFGGILGFCSGYAAIKIGKVLAFTVGMGFMAIQFCNYKGYTNVSWKPVQDAVTKAVDTDGDGQFTKKDALKLWKKFKSVMSYQL